MAVSNAHNDKPLPGCAAVQDNIVELALGCLAGKERVAALGHLEICARCSTEVEELSAAADELLHLAPEVEPPLGFEARVFERLGLSPEPGRATATPPGRWVGRRGRARFPGRARPGWRPSPVAAAAAAAAVVLAAGLGALTGYAAHGSTPGSQRAGDIDDLQAAPLVNHGRSMGTVLVYAGNPTWLFMSMDDPQAQGTLHCQVVLDDGRPVTLGAFWLSDGKGAWAASVDAPAGRIRQARVVDARGKVLAVAQLSRLS
jgi:hypothetical protein